jgi:hypothetical protein
MSNMPWGTITFNTLVKRYMRMQSQVMSMVKKVASKISQATPGRFLLLQFAMSQVTQIGSSISNLLSQVNNVISKAIQNQKTQ